MARFSSNDPPKAYTSPLVGHLLIRNPLANRLITLFDQALHILRPFLVKKSPPPAAPQCILLANIAQLGDVVMTTALLPAIKKRYPSIKIGLLVASWAFPLIENHPLVDHIHILDHWKINRSKTSLKTKWRRYRQMKKQCLAELKAIKYDMAFDLCYYFPSAAPLLWKAQIPYTTGYSSAGLSSLHTHPQIWRPYNLSAAHYFAALFTPCLPIDNSDLHPTLPIHIPKEVLLKKLKLTEGQFIIIHMGSGSTIKEWALNNWTELVDKLRQETIVMTGHGEKEQAQIAQVKMHHPHVIDLANQLALQEFVTLIASTKRLFSVDTVAGHIAGAFGTPANLLFTGIHPIAQWAPFNSHQTIHLHQTPCYPCYRTDGCNTMECIQKITPDDVYTACKVQEKSRSR